MIKTTGVKLAVRHNLAGRWVPCPTVKSGGAVGCTGASNHGDGLDALGRRLTLRVQQGDVCRGWGSGQ